MDGAARAAIRETQFAKLSNDPAVQEKKDKAPVSKEVKTGSKSKPKTEVHAEACKQKRESTAEKVKNMMTDPMIAKLSPKEQAKMAKQLTKMYQNDKKFKSTQAGNQPPGGPKYHVHKHRDGTTSVNPEKDGFSKALNAKLQPLADQQAKGGDIVGSRFDNISGENPSVSTEAKPRESLEEAVTNVMRESLPVILLEVIQDAPKVEPPQEKIINGEEKKAEASVSNGTPRASNAGPRVNIDSIRGKQILEKLKIEYTPVKIDPSMGLTAKQSAVEKKLSGEHDAMVATILGKSKVDKEFKESINPTNSPADEKDVYTEEKMTANDYKGMTLDKLKEAVINGSSIEVQKQNIPVALVLMDSIQHGIKPDKLDNFLAQLATSFKDASPNEKLNILKFFNGWAENLKHHTNHQNALKEVINAAKNDSNGEIREIGQVIDQNLERASKALNVKVPIEKQGAKNSAELMNKVKTGDIKVGSSEYKEMVKAFAGDLLNMKKSMMMNLEFGEMISLNTPGYLNYLEGEKQMKVFMYHQILSPSNPSDPHATIKESQRMIALFVDIASKAVEMGDFDTGADIITVLAGAAEISRNMKTFENGDMKTQKNNFNELKELFEHKNNYGALFKYIKSNFVEQGKPYVFIRNYFKLAAAVKESNKTSFEVFVGTPDNFQRETRFNIEKMSMLRDLKEQYEVAQSLVEFTGDNTTNITNNIMSGEFKSGDEYLKMSHAQNPRKAK